MKTLTRKLATIVSNFLKSQRQRIRRRSLESEISQTFRKLESRRVLSVSAVIGGGTLDITIANDGLGSTDAGLFINGANYFVDENNNLSFDMGEKTDLITSLQQINVAGAAGVGTFLWQGNFSSATLIGLNANNLASAIIDTTAALSANANIATVSSISFRTALTVHGDLTATASGAAGQISNTANASLVVDNNANLSAFAIDLGSAANDNIRFGTLTLNSTGNVSIVENDSTHLVGASTVGTLSLSSTGVNSDVQIDGSVTSSVGNITINSDDSISFGAAGFLTVITAGDAQLTSNADALNGDGNDGIFMADGSKINTNLGSIRLSSLGTDGGDITLGSLTSNNALNAITIRTTSIIIDGTVADNLADINLLASSGTINLESLNGSIGLGAAVADIDINGLNLVFNANNGAVQITDLAGGIHVTGVSTARNGGFLAANSPLTISADITVGASFAFTAGNDVVSPSDHLTIDTNAVVTLNSAIAQTLTFNAGDDIFLNTGRIVTTGGGIHTVLLNADLDGAPDGFRGRILQDGTPIVEVTTDNLIANAADGINLDTEVSNLTAINSNNGNIVIRESSAISLVNVQTFNGFINILAVGNIRAINVDSSNTDAAFNDITLRSTTADIEVQTVKAGPIFGNVSLDAFRNIVDNDSPLADGNDISGHDVTLSATTGSIGSTTPEIFREKVNALEISANNLVANAPAGLVAIDATLSGLTTITAISAWIQSNGDVNVPGPGVVVTNLALIADADHSGAGTVNLGPSLTVVGDLRIEGADIVAAGGSINLISNRLMVYSGQTEILNVNTTQIDASVFGDLTIKAAGTIELIDLSVPYFTDHPTPPAIVPLIDRDNIAVQTLSKDGFIVVESPGSIIVTDDVISGNDLLNTGNGTVTLRANGAISDIFVNDVVLADNGSILVEANRNIDVGTTISLNEAGDTDNLPLITTVSGNVGLRADADGSVDGGAITMADGSRIIAGRDASTIYNPGLDGTPSSAVVLGVVAQAAGAAEIRMLADGAVNLGSVQTANNGSNAILVQSLHDAIKNAGNLAGANLIANLPTAVVTLQAVKGIGDNAPIQTNVYQLSARNTVGPLPTGSIKIEETAPGGDLTLLTSFTNDAPTGDIQVKVDSGNLIVNTPVNTLQGNILLRASEDVSINRDVISLSGHITVSAGDDIIQSANITTGGVGTIYLEAGKLAPGSTHDVMMSGTATITTTNQNVVVDANGNIALVKIDAGTANVSLRASESITDAKGDNSLNVIATILRMVADSDNNGSGMIGGNDLPNTPDQNVNAIDTQVATLAAKSAQGIYVREANAIVVGNSGTIEVTQVNFHSLTSNVADPNINLAGMTTTAGGPIKLQSVTGDMTISSAVSANGVGAPPANGDVLLQTLAGNIIVNAIVHSDSGFVSIKSTGDVTINVGASITTVGSGVLIAVPGNIFLGTINAGSGDVSLQAGNSILNTLGETINVTANNLQMIATTGSIGLPNKLNPDLDKDIFAIGTQVNLLAARSATGIYVREADGLVVGDTGALAFTSVNFNSSRTSTVVPGLNGLTTTAGGPILLQLLSGNLTVNSSINANGNADVDADGIIDGEVLLQTRAASGDIVVNANINSEVGHISLKSFDDILLSGNITTGGPGTVYLESGKSVAGTDHDVIMSATATITTASQNVAFVANGGIALGIVNAGTADVSLTATESIRDAKADNSTNIFARNLSMVADSDANGSGTIGSSDLLNTANQNVNAIDTSVDVIAAKSAQGIYLHEANGLTVGTVGPITVKQVNFNSTTQDVTAAAIAGLATTANGPIKLQSVVGDLLINQAVNANGAGDVLLQTLNAGSVVVNAVVQSGTGHISIKAFDDILLNVNLSTGGAGTIYLETGASAAGTTHDIVMAAGTSITTANQSIAMVANGKIDLRVINAGTGDVSLTAAESIIDAKADTTLNITARNLRMIADSDGNGTGFIGASDLPNTADQNVNAIDTSVTLLAARSAQGTYIREVNDIVVGDTGTITVKQVNFNSTTPDLIATALAGLTTTANGPIKLQSVAGNIVVDRAINANGSGDTLLQTLGAGSITVNAAVQSGSGHISIKSFDDIRLNANITTGGVGTVYLESGKSVAGTTHDVVMSATATITTANQNVLVAANGNIALGVINAGTGDVSLTAAESITDAKADNNTNITARNLRMVADSDGNGTGGIGASDLPNTANQNTNAIDTSIDLVAARSAQGIYIREINGLTIGTVGAITVKQVNFNSTTADVTAAALASLTSTVDGPIKLQSVVGDLVVDQAINANGSGDVLLQTLSAGSIVVNAIVLSGTGHVSLKAFDDILLNANITTGGAGTVYLETGASAVGATHDIVMSLGTSITTVNQNIALAANGKIDLRTINAGTGDVSLTAAESINDAKADNAVNITARNLRMLADSDGNGTGFIGASDLPNTADQNVNAIDTSVTLLAARSAQGTYIREVNDIVVGDTGTITVKQVNFNSTTPDLIATALAGLTTTPSGPIKLQSVSGNIVVDRAINANGSGDTLLQTLSAGSITVNAAVQSGSGHISIKSFDDLFLNANITTGGAGTIYLETGRSAAGTTHDVVMSATATITTANQNVIVSAKGNIALGIINAGTGNVSLTAAESITDANANTLNITARNLRMLADSDINGTGLIGTAADAIDTAVSVLAAKSETGINILESDGVTIDSTGDIAVEQVNFNSSRSPKTDLSLQDLQAVTGSIQLATTTGNIQINTLIAAGNNVTLKANLGWIDEGNLTVHVDGKLLTVVANEFVHLHDTRVLSLDATVGKNGLLNDAVQKINKNASERGDDFLNNLTTVTNPTGNADLSGYRFEGKYEGKGYALFIVNTGDLVINNIVAGPSETPNVYVETRGSTDLRVSGPVITKSTTVDEGGIVLVAGRDLVLDTTLAAKLETQTTLYTQTIEQIGLDVSYLNGRFFDAGEGIEPNSVRLTTTRYVIPVYTGTNGEDLDYQTHAFQKVVMQFGNAGEAGFVAIVGYAGPGAMLGKNYEVFDTAGEQGTSSERNGNAAPITNFPRTSAIDAAVFTRSEENLQTFLIQNQLLPTDAIVRRASDFFLFENGSALQSSDVKDLSFEAAPIAGVTSQGGLGGSTLPPNLPPQIPTIPVSFSIPIIIAPPPLIKPPEIELVAPIERVKEVTVYRVIYQDIDQDGQPDQEELPNSIAVLDQLSKKEHPGPLGQTYEKLKVIIPTKDGLTPTPAEIEAFKAEIRANPDSPAGAYAIVEKGPDGKEQVVEVFAVRDWEEKQSEQSDELPIMSDDKSNTDPNIKPENKAKPEDGASLFPPTWGRVDESIAIHDDPNGFNQQPGRSRIALAGLLFSSLWIVRETTKPRKDENSAILDFSSVGFSAHERRQRKLRANLES